MISVKGVAAIGGIAAFGAFSAAVLAPPARADELYGAIAYSPTNGVTGASRNYPTKEAAEARAMEECANRPPEHPEHPSQCKVISSGRSPCWALASGPKVGSYSPGYGATIEEAETAAMSHSSAGWIVFTFCHTNGGPEGFNGEV